jgi:SAM-dependent methyltransferase/uncharacterized protein YbaR (Trm112 family)
MVAGTNGRAYVDVVNRLKRYPIPDLPVPASRGGWFLDIGSGWGRWMIAAARKGFMPVGVDIKFDGALATTQILADLNLPGYVVVADLQTLPFASESFDFVWSFSVIQHVHRASARRCLAGIARVLKPDGECKLEFPLRTGVWNRRHPSDPAQEDDESSWCVRYYTVDELRAIFTSEFGSFDYMAHCYFGIGYQPVDLQFVPWRLKPVILASMGLTALSYAMPALKPRADSIYVSARKPSRDTTIGQRAPTSLSADRATFYSMLRCPRSGATLKYDVARQELIADGAPYAYPVREGIPILVAAEARIL